MPPLPTSPVVLSFEAREPNEPELIRTTNGAIRSLTVREEPVGIDP